MCVDLCDIDFYTIVFLSFQNREMTPGQHECERAVEELRKLFQEIDKAIMNVDSLRKTEKSLQV
jgi:hypothetical protein